LKLLLDKCVSPRTRAALEAAGHDAVWAGDWSSDPGDAAILDAARRESRVLITLDKDFGELAVAFGQPHCGIVRLVDIHPRDQTSVCQSALGRHGEELAAGAIVTVARGRMRVRPPDSREP
jgi:predicted nuclease of predicted toxin-antitoxin system